MISFLDPLREFSFASVLFRLLLSVLVAGTLGIEREQKLKPAGFRTYSFVCLGAALTMILGQYESVMLSTVWAPLASSLGVSSDISRIGAQVINGIGFLGAGTIIVTGRQEVKGVTTAAGLWASACIGLAIGAGFYEIVIIGFFMIILSMRFFTRIEEKIIEYSRIMNLYVEFTSINNIAEVISLMKQNSIEIFDMELNRGKGKDSAVGPNAVFYIKLPKQEPHVEIISMISQLINVTDVEEI